MNLRLLLTVFLCIIGTMPIATAQYWAAYNEWDGNKLYANYKNLIEIAFETAPNTSIHLGADRGKLSGENGVYNFQTNEPGPVQIFALLGNDTIMSEQFAVFPLPEPKLCMQLRVPNKKSNLVPTDLMGGVWLQNPVDIYSKMDLIEVQIDYTDAGGYVGSITLEGNSIKRPGKLPVLNSNPRKMWIAHYSYRTFDGSKFTVRDPVACDCPPRGTDFYEQGRPSQQLLTTKLNKAIELFSYPAMYGSLCKKHMGTVTAEELNTATRIGITPIVGDKTWGFTIDSYMLRIRRKSGKIETYTSNSASITPAIQEALSRIQPAERIEISNIKASNQNKTTALLNVSLRVIAKTTEQ